MYVLRRTYAVKPGMARKFATNMMQMTDAFEAAGQRGPSRVYYNPGSVPGEKDRVIVEWITDVIESPYRKGNQIPQTVREVGAKGHDLYIDSSIEYFELMTPDKADYDY